MRLFIYPISILLSTLLLSSGYTAFGQKVNFVVYTNHSYKYSFEIPSYWKIIYNKEVNELLCIPKTKSQIKEYEDCFEGIVFRMECFTTSLDSTLANKGYTKNGDKYNVTMGPEDSIDIRNIKGRNWKGIYHDNLCGVTCNGAFHSAAGQCESIYFSNGKVTLSIITNGRELDDKILKRLMASFKFI